MNIPEEAIEKAAQKIFEHDAPSHLPEEWEPLNKYAKFGYRETARAALSAAAPTLMARALREAVSDFECHVGVGEFAEQTVRNGRPWAHTDEAWEHQGPYMNWLNNRADELEQS